MNAERVVAYKTCVDKLNSTPDLPDFWSEGLLLRLGELEGDDNDPIIPLVSSFERLLAFVASHWHELPDRAPGVYVTVDGMFELTWRSTREDKCVYTFYPPGRMLGFTCCHKNCVWQGRAPTEMLLEMTLPFGLPS